MRTGRQGDRADAQDALRRIRHDPRGREIYRDVKADDAPATIERMLTAYLANRIGAQETFADFTRRHDIDALKSLFETKPSE